VPITSVIVPPFFALEDELPVDELEELPQAASTITAPAATTAIKADLESLLIKKVLLLRGWWVLLGEMYS
jgi:hypothetical protein